MARGLHVIALASCRKLALILAVSGLLSSCGFTPYRPFPNHEEFPFGIQSVSDLYLKYGQAKTAYVYTVNTEITKQYCYLGRDFVPLIKASNICYFFWKDSLVGYQYVSYAKPDARDISLKDFEEVVKGVTTKSDVMKILGRPNGIYRYPIVKDKDEEAYYYASSRMFTDTADAAEVSIVYNKAGIVTEVNASGSIFHRASGE